MTSGTGTVGVAVAWIYFIAPGLETPGAQALRPYRWAGVHAFSLPPGAALDSQIAARFVGGNY